MVERDDDVGAGVVEIVEAPHFDPEQRAVDDRQRVAERARRHGAADGDGDQQACDAEQEKQLRRGHSGFLQDRHDDGAARHEGGVEHIDRGHHAGAAVGAGPGLHRREDRHDEQAAGDGEPGEVERKSEAAGGAEDREVAFEPGDRRRAVRRPAEVDGEQAQQHRTDQGRQQNDAPGREPGRQPRADGDRNREDRQAGRDHLLVAAEHVLDQRRHQRERDRADQPEPAGHQRAPPQPRILAQELQQTGGGGEDVLLHHEVRRRLRRCAG